MISQVRREPSKCGERPERPDTGHNLLPEGMRYKRSSVSLLMHDHRIGPVAYWCRLQCSFRPTGAGDLGWCQVIAHRCPLGSDLPTMIGESFIDLDGRKVNHPKSLGVTLVSSEKTSSAFG